MSFLADEFILRALIAGAVVGAAAPAIGTFLVQRRLSLMGDGIGHIAFAGVALGLWLGVSPLLAALVTAGLGALGIDIFRRRDPESGDMALALFFYASIAAAVVIASLTGSFGVNLFAVLFGQVLTVTTTELVAITGLALLVLAVVVGLYKGLVTTAIDEESAAIAGLPVGALNIGLMLLTAMTIALGMRVVGILLIAALMVLPVGAARGLVRSFRGTLIAASVVGVVSAVLGIIISYQADSAPSGTIVLVAAAAYILSDASRLWRRRLGHKGRA